MLPRNAVLSNTPAFQEIEPVLSSVRQARYNENASIVTSRLSEREKKMQASTM